MRETRYLAVLFAVAAMLLASSVIACGGSGTDKPTSVSTTDLKKDGKFWKTLTPDLKEELVELAQADLGKQRPDGESEINAVPTSKGVKGMDTEYSNTSKESQSVRETYTAVNDKIAQQTFEELTPRLEEGQ